MLNYLYQNWYTPCHDIEFGQFIGKLIRPTSMSFSSDRESIIQVIALNE